MSNNELKELIQAKMTHLSAKMEESDDRIRDKLDELISHVKETNGRVGRLECQTSLVRWFHRNPELGLTLLAVIVFGIVGIVGYIGLETILKGLMP